MEEAEDPDRPAGTEYQLIALTYTGGWYRLSIPTTSGHVAVTSPASPVTGPVSVSPPSARGLPMHRPRSSSGSSVISRAGKGRERDREKEKEKESRQCVLREFRRYGRWDGWG